MSSNNDSLAMQRILKLVDENSFMEIGSLVTARSTDFNLAGTSTPSDGVITGYVYPLLLLPSFFNPPLLILLLIYFLNQSIKEVF